MGFVYEKIPEEDLEFARNMGMKNCWGSNPKPFSLYSRWSVNREKNVYLVKIGGGMHEVPLIADLWWNGSIVRIEYDEIGTVGGVTTGVDMVRNINRIIVPKALWNKRDEITELIKEGFSVIYWALTEENTKSITININCQPTLTTKGEDYGE